MRDFEIHEEKSYCNVVVVSCPCEVELTANADGVEVAAKVVTGDVSYVDCVVSLTFHSCVIFLSSAEYG